MKELLVAMIGALLAGLRPRASLVAENLALRQQLAVLCRTVRRPRLRPVDRAFWVVLSRAWSRWADAVAIVKPATVIAWHRRGFASFWANKSRRIGRPPLEREVIELIERMVRENPTWSRRRIAGELAKLGHRVDKNTVAKYMPKAPVGPRRPPSQTWGPFIRNHLAGTLAIDFLTVPTVTFDVLYVFFVLSLERRRVLHVNVTAHPHAGWAAQQVVEALGPRRPAGDALDPRSRQRLRQGVRRTGGPPRHSTDADRSSFSLAERLRGTVRGHAPTRVARARHRIRATTLAAPGSCLHRLLQ